MLDLPALEDDLADALQVLDLLLVPVEAREQVGQRERDASTAGKLVLELASFPICYKAPEALMALHL